MGKVVLAVFVCQPNDALTLSLCRAKVMRGLAIFVEVAWHLAVVTGVAAVTAGEAGGFSSLGRGHTSL
jgi:hypothetical protein